MALLKVAPSVIEDHMNAIKATVASIENHQQAVTRIVQDPSLQAAGLNNASVQEAHQGFNTATTNVNTNMMALLNALGAHSNNFTETDAQLAKQVH